MGNTTNRISSFTSFSGKTVVITGGLDGIGAACAELFLECGAQVAVSHLPTEQDKARAGVFCGQSEYRSAHPLDLLDPSAITQFWKDVTSRWGAPDILINNAAVGSATVSAFATDTAAQDSAMFGINADGTLKMCQHFLSQIPQASDGTYKLINMSSVGGGLAVFPSMRASDGMSKAAVAYLTRQIAVCPGATNTKMFQASTLNKMDPKTRENFIANLPKGRLIEPEEIATLVVFLASEHSTIMHGAVIDASMGLGVNPSLMNPG